MSGRTVRVAGVGYTVAWCVGLTVFASSTTVNSTGSELLNQYAGHSAQLALQFVLTQGLAAVLLGIVFVRWTAAAMGTDRTWLRATGGAAVTVSLVQCMLGLVLSVIAVPADDEHAIGALAAALNRLDGVKMLLLAIALGTVALARSLSRPRWSAVLCAAAALALLVSAVGYGLLADRVAMAAYLSLPLLLAAVTAGAFVVGPAAAGDRRAVAGK